MNSKKYATLFCLTILAVSFSAGHSDQNNHSEGNEAEDTEPQLSGQILSYELQPALMLLALELILVAVGAVGSYRVYKERKEDKNT